MNITRKSALTGVEHTMDLPVTDAQMEIWNKQDRPLIQSIFPDLCPEHREFILTGIIPQEWKCFEESAAGNQNEEPWTWPVELFDWNKDTGTFVAEVSELTAGKGFVDGEFVVLLNNKTGNKVRFYRAVEKRDNDGDIQFWRFLPDDETKKNYPSIKKLVIFND